MFYVLDRDATTTQTHPSLRRAYTHELILYGTPPGKSLRQKVHEEIEVRKYFAAVAGWAHWIR